MEFGILGPLEVRADRRAVAVPGARPRAVLAVLLLHANQPVSAQRLAIALWGEDAPAGAVKTVQVHVSRLRSALPEAEALVTTPSGYRLRVGVDELDAERFERRVVAGDQALAAGRADEAADLLREALSLWRGPPLAEFHWAPFAAEESSRLDELRMGALELRVEADLAAGRHRELVAELQQLTSGHPWRERLHGQLMLALYRSGRQAEALDAYRSARSALSDQLGIEPGPELQGLQQAILVHDPALAVRSGEELRVEAVPPLPPTPIFGREEDLRQIAALLDDPAGRLVTITGAGGIGKTRLAIETARSRAGRFVSLASTAEVDQVPSAILDALDLAQIPGEGAEDSLYRALAGERILLVLDNLEHLLPAAQLFAELLERAPGITVLATSRQALGLRAERVFPVAPLALPAEGNVDAVDSPAVELFADRARARDPAFEPTGESLPAIVEICRRLDGVPLAIELAAGRVGVLGTAELSARLANALSVLGPGPQDAPARQRTVRATLDWSYDLLDIDERGAFAALGAFAGGCEVGAAEAVTGHGLPVLEALVAKSLVIARGGRLSLLEPVRQYAQQRLDHHADIDAVHARHLEHYRNLVEAAGYELWARGRSAEGFDRVHRERDNLRAALSWAIERRTVDAVALAGAMGDYWHALPAEDEARRWYRLALDHTDERLPAALEARARHAWAVNAVRLPEGAAQAAAALKLYRSLDDQAGIAKCLVELSYIRAGEGQWAASRSLADEALAYARSVGDPALTALATGQLALSIRPIEDALPVYRDAASKMRAAGATARLTGMLSTGGYTALLDDAYDQADMLLAEALELARVSSHPVMLAAVYGNVGLAALLQGRDDDAASAFTEELTLAHAGGYAADICYEGILGFAAIAAQRGDLRRAAALHAAASEHQDQTLEVSEKELLQRIEERFLAPARERLGDYDWERAGDAGRRLTTEQAIALALEAGIQVRG